MRIALLTTYFPPDTNAGIGRYVEDLARGFASNGHDVEVIAVGKKCYSETYRDGYKIHWLLTPTKWIPSAFPFLRLLLASYKCRKKLIEHHKKNPFDFVEYPNSEIAGLFSILFKFPNPRPKFIVRLTSPRTIVKKSFNLYRVTEYLEALLVRTSDAILAVSRTNYLVCQASYKFSSNKPYEIVLLGLPFGSTTYQSQPLSKSDNVLRVFYLGRMEDRKGFDVLAKAWLKVVETIPNVKLIVAGEDFPHLKYPSFFAWSIKDIPASSLDSIEYVGVVDFEKKELLYQQCDVFAMPSRYESFGLTSIEAMRYGKPVVSSDVGGIPEVVKNGNTGLLVSVEDHNALAEALISLLTNTNLREVLGSNALEDVKQRFTNERVISETELFYKSLSKN